MERTQCKSLDTAGGVAASKGVLLDMECISRCCVIAGSYLSVSLFPISSLAHLHWRLFVAFPGEGFYSHVEVGPLE